MTEEEIIRKEIISKYSEIKENGKMTRDSFTIQSHNQSLVKQVAEDLIGKGKINATVKKYIDVTQIFV